MILIVKREMVEEMKELEAQYLVKELAARRLKAIRFGLEDQGILQPKLAQ